MNTTTTPPETDWTAADLFGRFGLIPLRRIHFHPAPGTATEQDVTEVHDRGGRPCELVDGVLLAKPVGFYESRLAMLLGHLLQTFLDTHDLGVIAGEAGMSRLKVGQVRIPDLSFVAWQKLSGHQIPSEPIPDLVPDLAVEVLSKGNTPEEMSRKLREYFAAGVCLVWYINPRRRSVEVFTNPEPRVELGPNDILDGGEVLPGFWLSLKSLWDRAGQLQARAS